MNRRLKLTHLLLLITIFISVVNIFLCMKSLNSEKSGYSQNLTLSKNLFNKDNAEYGVVVNQMTGEIYENENYCVSDFIQVESGKSYVETEGLYLAFYDENKIFISGEGLTDNPMEARKIVVPPKGRYVRISVRKDNIDYFQLEMGKKETAYQPYGYIENRKIFHSSEIPEILLPKNIYATVGKEFDIYFKNIGLLGGGGGLCCRL